jgi:hypothetical protein
VPLNSLEGDRNDPTVASSWAAPVNRAVHDGNDQSYWAAVVLKPLWFANQHLR